MNEWDAREVDVTAGEARAEIELHGHLWADFVRDCGNKPEYSGAQVLDWLGY